MSDLGPTLIRSKLQIPSASGLLHRRRLCDAVTQGLRCKLTLISAPAGYGKTSALVDFAQHTSAPVCWYTVDERDRDVSLFVRYVAGAIHEQFPSFGEAVREAVASHGSELFREPTAIVGDLVNEMLDLDQDFVLVIDNFEPVEGALGIREFVHRLLEVLPSNCHLMVASRVLPDLPVTRLVARRQLVGLAERDLRFNADEIQELLQSSGIDASLREARAITENAEGWITGVLLALDLIREEAEPVAVDVEKATSHTYDYLAAEVLDRQPPDLRRFLHASSVLREMSGPLCRSVLGVDRARSLLAEVERRNLFLIRFGHEGRASYRYHGLFREFLQGRLRREEPATYAELHRRAAAWFEDEHDVEEAVYHYVAAEAYPKATTLMEQACMEWFHRGRVETLAGWTESLPERIKSRAPRLLLYQGKALTDRYEYEGARKALAYAEAGFSDRGDSASLASVHNQKATLLLFEGRYDDALTEAQLALEMSDREQLAEQAQAERMIGRAEIGLGRFAAGVAELEKALALYRQIGSPYDVLNLFQDLAFAFAGQGRLEEAKSYLGEALPLARRLGAPTQLAGVLNSLGWIHQARGSYREALELYEEGLAAARRGDDPRSQANIAEGMATVYRDLGDHQRAEALYDAAWRIASENRPWLAALILAARADMYRWQDDQSRALAMMEQAHQLAEENELDAKGRGLLRLGQGIALAEKGEVDQGLQLLASAICSLEHQGAQRDLARGHFLKAKAHLLGDQERQAVDALDLAMELAHEMGTDQFAVVEGQYASELLDLGCAHGIHGCRDIVEKVKALHTLRQDLLREGSAEREGGEEGYLEIRALGAGRVIRDGQPVSSSDWRSAMAKELFFYILLHGPVERDAVGLVFWPDLPADKVTNNFHSTLWRVRQAVGSDAVVVKNSRYAVGVDYWFDLREFESLVERARLLPPHDWQAQELWREAVELYQGDLLSHVDRAWCVSKREEVRAEYIEALVELARCHEARGALDEAVGWYRRALEEDGLREDIHRSIMRAYVERGRRSDALAQYRLCRETLRQELGVGPSQETHQLYQELVGGGGG